MEDVDARYAASLAAGAKPVMEPRDFGYTHENMDMGPEGMYHVLKDAAGKPRGGVMKSPQAGMPAMWMPYVEVEDADGTAARVAPLGGTLHLAPHDIPGVGRIGVLVDPLGAAIGFIKSAVMP